MPKFPSVCCVLEMHALLGFLSVAGLRDALNFSVLCLPSGFWWIFFRGRIFINTWVASANELFISSFAAERSIFSAWELYVGIFMRYMS